MGPKLDTSPGRRWIVLVLAGLGIALWFQQSGLETVVELRNAWRVERLREQKIQAIRAENDRIEASIRELGPSGGGVEKLARQELGMAKPGQTVIKIPDKQ